MWVKNLCNQIIPFFIIMPQIVNHGSELIRINTAKNCVEYSNNNGHSWYSRYSGSSCGTFHDLLYYGKDLLAATSKGVYYSNNDGRSWYLRYTTTSSGCGEFLSLSDGGREVLASTSKGFFYSNNEGHSWYRRG